MVHYEVPTGVLVQEVLSETVLLDTERGEYYELNPMGTAIFQQISKLGDPSLVIPQILREFNVEEEELRKDLDQLIHDLEAHGLLKRKAS